MRTRLRGRVNTRNGALLLRVVLIDGIFEAGAKIRGDSRSVPPRRGVEAEGGTKMTKMGKANGESGCLLGNNSSSVTRSSSQT